jgi:cysteine desulfurase / selenocysteine lyase
MLDVSRIQKDFPILQQQMREGKKLTFLDSAATSQKPLSVIQAEADFYSRLNAPIHRGAYYLGELATEAYEKARATVAAFINANDDEIVFVRNATEAINVVAAGFSSASAKARFGNVGELESQFVLEPGDEILLTEMEHHANLVPWQEVAMKTGAVLRFIPLTDDGRLDLSDLESLVSQKTKVVSFTWVSNILGTINPVAEIIKAAKRVAAITLVDACQSIPHMPSNLKELDADFVAFSGHKMLGPLGVGVLYGKREMLDALPVFITGGSMIETVHLEHSTYAPAPQKFEAGTPAAAAAVGLAAAIDYLTNLDMKAVHEHEQMITESALTALNEIKGVRIIGPNNMQDRAGAISFVVEGLHPHDVGQFLDAQGVAVRVGHHCAWPVCRRYSVPATTRASFYVYNDEADIVPLVAGVRAAQKFFGVS